MTYKHLVAICFISSDTLNREVKLLADNAINKPIIVPINSAICNVFLAPSFALFTSPCPSICPRKIVVAFPRPITKTKKKFAIASDTFIQARVSTPSLEYPIL